MTYISISSELAAKIVRCIEDAVGDDIRADIQKSGLRTGNSIPARIWDLLNTNISDMLPETDCEALTAKRGFWDMLIVYEKSTQCIMTFMREERFKELRRKQKDRTQMHYIDIFARMFNGELVPGKEQMSLLPHVFSDEDKLAERAQSILRDLEGGTDVVKHHVLVLFEASAFQLTSVRAVMITPSLDVAQGCEENWSQYISAAESVIADKISRPSAPVNQPNHGLKFKDKAIARQRQDLAFKDNQEEEKKHG